MTAFIHISVTVGTVFYRHIPYRTTTERREALLHNASFVVERIMQVSAESNYLRIFRKDRRKISRIPLIAEQTSIARIMYHRVSYYKYMFFGFLCGYLFKNIRKPFLCVVSVSYRRNAYRRKRYDMLTADNRMTVSAHSSVNIRVKAEMFFAETIKKELLCRKLIFISPEKIVPIAETINDRNKRLHFIFIYVLEFYKLFFFA